MKLLIACVGEPRDTALAAAIAEYERRAARYWPLEAIVVASENGRGLPPQAVLEREGTRLLKRLASCNILTCEEGGKRYTSEAFASMLQRVRESAQTTAIVIGGAHGLHASIKTRSAGRLSLAPWTLPHEMARLVLAEQLYRAGTILRGEPYHKR